MASIPFVQQATPADDLTWQMMGICERLASVVLFIALSPVMVGSALVLALMSRRSPLIAHRRVGWRGSALWMLKLRTMWDQRDDNPRRQWQWVERIDDQVGPDAKHDEDPRVANWFARFCRRHSIDEIPQLWHVMRGEMTLIGPRPITAAEIRRYYGANAGEVLEVKPGIAGLWQTSGRNRLTYEERRRLDLHFVRHRSSGMYLRILLRTIPEVWSGANTC